MSRDSGNPFYDGIQNSPEWTAWFVEEREKLRKEGRENERGTPIQANPQYSIHGNLY